jgi:hypothetical protein
MTRIAQLTGAALLAALVALAALSAAACGGSDSSQSVVAPTGTVTTDTFNGTLNPPANNTFQANVHPFTINTGGGSINITLVSAGPPSTIQLGLGLGNPSATGTCSIISGFTAQTAAGSTAQISAAGAPAGAYCVVVVDVGNVLQTVTYTVTVAHT